MKRTQPEIIKALSLNMNSFPSMIESFLFIEGFAKPHCLELSSRAPRFSMRGDPQSWEIAAFRSFHSLYSQ